MLTGCVTSSRRSGSCEPGQRRFFRPSEPIEANSPFGTTARHQSGIFCTLSSSWMPTAGSGRSVATPACCPGSWVDWPDLACDCAPLGSRLAQPRRRTTRRSASVRLPASRASTGSGRREAGALRVVARPRATAGRATRRAASLAPERQLARHGAQPPASTTGGRTGGECCAPSVSTLEAPSSFTARSVQSRHCCRAGRHHTPPAGLLGSPRPRRSGDHIADPYPSGSPVHVHRPALPLRPGRVAPAILAATYAEGHGPPALARI
jgi:hypothetical protein